MRYTAKEIADIASFQAFMNSYIREVGEIAIISRGEWVKSQRPSFILNGNEILSLTLPLQNIQYVLEIDYRSLVGRHTFGSAYKYERLSQSWIEEERLPVMIACIQELHLKARDNGCPGLASHYDELILRLIDSYQTMAAYIEERINEPWMIPNTFIDSEQSLLFGHWLHPTPKSRQGMAYWQHQNYAPELRGKFQLHYFRLKSSFVKEATILEKKPTDIIADILKQADPKIRQITNEVLIPMHPLQAQWLMQQPYIREAVAEGYITYLGALGKEYTATSSIRTVYEENEQWMFKFSIPVKITNSLRVNKVSELKAGVVMAKLLEKLNFLEKHPRFRMIEDPGYIYAEIPGKEAAGFEMVIRSNPFPKGQDKGITSIVALAQDPLPGSDSMLKTIIRNLSYEEGRSITEISLTWFKHYWECTVEPMLFLYDEHGVALEAHQQNSILDLSSGYPTAFYFRDNQGYYLSILYREHLEQFGVNLNEVSELFYEEETIHERFCYYLLVNHIFALVHRFGADELLKEEVLLEWIGKALRDFTPKLSTAGKRFVHFILNNEKLSCKANLLTRFHDVDELLADMEQAVYTAIPNPLYRAQKITKGEKTYAAAVTL